MSPPVHDPNRRMRYVFEPHGDTLVADISVEPGGEVPTHIHARQEERFDVSEGELRVTVDGDSRTLKAGERAVAPAGSRHRFENVGPGEARVRVEIVPAGTLQAFLEEAAEGARAGLYTRRGLPRSLRGAMWMARFTERHRAETVLCSPPPFVQRLTLTPLLALSRRRS